MSKIAIFMADGCEEIEGLTVVDMLRRAGITIDMISINSDKNVTGSHGIAFMADAILSDTDIDSYDGLVLPGGMPGTTNLGANETVVAKAKEFADAGKLVAAICAAPSVLGDNGILQGKRACCYPGMEDRLKGAEVSMEPATTDANIITGRGMGAAIDFALAIITYFCDAKTADDLAGAIVYR